MILDIKGETVNVDRQQSHSILVMYALKYDLGI